MHACSVGERDLKAAVRESGGTKIDEVEIATMERDGNIAVVLNNKH